MEPPDKRVAPVRFTNTAESLFLRKLHSTYGKMASGMINALVLHSDPDRKTASLPIDFNVKTAIDIDTQKHTTRP